MADLADIAAETEALHNQVAMQNRDAQRREECGDGICDRCSDPIDPRRLEVRPNAELCVSCQTDADRRRRTLYGAR